MKKTLIILFFIIIFLVGSGYFIYDFFFFDRIQKNNLQENINSDEYIKCEKDEDCPKDKPKCDREERKSFIHSDGIIFDGVDIDEFGVCTEID